MLAPMKMFTYSAKKKKAHLKPVYSVWKPLTSSDYASAKSKGVLFVSATALKKNIKNPKN